MKGLLGIWLVICVCACTSKDVCHVQGRIKGIKDDVEIAVLRQGAGVQYDTVMNVSMQGGRFQFDLPGEYYGEAYELQFGSFREGLFSLQRKEMYRFAVTWILFSSPGHRALGEMMSGRVINGLRSYYRKKERMPCLLLK